MGWASVGSLGTNTAKAAGATLALSPSSNVPVGDFVAIWVSWESDYFFGPDERQNQRMACTDDAGNWWASLATWYVPGSGTELVALFVCRLRVALTTGSTITLTHKNAALVAKAMSAWQFTTSGTAYRWAATLDNTGGNGSVGVDPPATSIGSLPSQEYLYLYALSASAPSTDAYTFPGGWTQITAAGTTGGTAASNKTILGAFKIATSTGESIDVSSDTADRNYSQALTAVCETVLDPFFPTAPILDDFDRADEDPLVGGWQIGGSNPGFSLRKLRVTSNQCAMSLTTGGGAGSQWWGGTFTGNAAEVYCDVPTLGMAIAYMFGSGNGNDSTLSANICVYQPAAFYPTPTDSFIVGSPGFNGDPAGSNKLPVYRTGIAPVRIGVQWRNPIQNLWGSSNSAWDWMAGYLRTAPFVMPGTKTGLSVDNDSGTRIDNYGGGASIPPPGTTPLLPILGVGP